MKRYSESEKSHSFKQKYKKWVSYSNCIPFKKKAVVIIIGELRDTRDASREMRVVLHKYTEMCRVVAPSRAH